MAAAGPFEGFPRDAFTFFDQLASHNDRDCFHARKDLKPLADWLRTHVVPRA